MEKINIFERFFRSIIDFNFSNYFIKEKTSKSIGLLFFGYLLFLIGLIICIMIAITPFFDSLDNDLIGAIDEVPDFIIEQGEFKFLNNSVYYEKEFDGSMILFDLENRNQDSYYVENYKDYLLVKKDGIYQNNMMIFGFNSLPTVVDKLIVSDMISYVKPMFILGVGFASILGIIGLFLVSAFVWAIVIVMNGFVKSSLSSADCYKVAIHAMVLPGILFFLNWVLPISMFYFIVIYLVVVCFYVYKFLTNYLEEEFEMETIYE